MPTLKERWKAATKDRKIAYGFVGAPLLLVLLSLVAYKCKAEPYFFLGLENEIHKGLICYPDAVNPLAANLGIGYTFIRREAWELNAQWQHHSCGFDDDYNVYDAYGIQLRWYPTRWWR